MPFWTTAHDDATIKDPKRKFRFQVSFDKINASSGGAILWYAKTATKPSFQIAAAEHKYLNHTFYYPGSVTWQDVTITLVDPTDPDMSATLSSIITKGGYTIPANANSLETISKAKASSALGQVTVTQLDSDGNPLETWTLWNPFVTEVKYGDLEYGGDDLTEISITLKYDWAQLATSNTGGSVHTDDSGQSSYFSATDTSS